MTQRSNLIKYKKNLVLVNKYRKKKELIFSQLFYSKSFVSKIILFEKLRKYPRNSSITRLRNYCLVTGRPRGFYRFFGISRNILRLFAQNCILPGLQKSSW